MTITIRMSEREATLIKAYAKAQNKPVSEIIRDSTLGRIEDEIDLASYLQAMQEHRENPQTKSFDEVWEMINADE